MRTILGTWDFERRPIERPRVRGDATSWPGQCGLVGNIESQEQKFLSGIGPIYFKLVRVKVQ